ncbi:MAG TPA: hypothetical protein VFT56_14730 [Sphingomonas sp.]|nr:hypothetical protein [Sphingomonas sp.]
MRPIEPLPLNHSWPLSEQDGRFALGQLFECGPGGFPHAVTAHFDGDELARFGAGRWECDLRDNSLSWTAGVFDIFGLPRGAEVSREEAVALYAEESRAIMERLRAYAIRHQRGFTVDVELRPASGNVRWMRLIAAPVCSGDRVVRLQGLKCAL